MMQGLSRGPPGPSWGSLGAHSRFHEGPRKHAHCTQDMRHMRTRHMHIRHTHMRTYAKTHARHQPSFTLILACHTCRFGSLLAALPPPTRRAPTRSSPPAGLQPAFPAPRPPCAGGITLGHQWGQIGGKRRGSRRSCRRSRARSCRRRCFICSSLSFWFGKVSSTSQEPTWQIVLLDLVSWCSRKRMKRILWCIHTKSRPESDMEFLSHTQYLVVITVFQMRLLLSLVGSILFGCFR